MSGRLRILIADHPAICRGIRVVLGDGVEICAEAADAEQAIRAAMREQPDACLVGQELAGDWVAAVRGIGRAAPGAAVVVLVQDGDADDLLDAVRAGATGYLTGALDTERLLRVIHAVAEGEAVVPRAMVMELVLELRLAEDLTNRESQVLGLLRRGHSTAEIAGRLDVCPVTVRRHIGELVHKLGVENRAALASAGPWTGGSAQARGRLGHSSPR